MKRKKTVLHHILAEKQKFEKRKEGGSMSAKDEFGTTKYVIYAEFEANGIVERPDVVGAIFGQTEGLLGDDLDLRELQKTGRIGRIRVEVHAKAGKTYGTITVPSSLDRVETAILAAALETIDRVGPAEAKIKVLRIEDVRATKRKYIIERAKEILETLMEQEIPETQELTEEVKKAVRAKELIEYGPEKLPAGPHVPFSDSIIVVEGRADVLNLLKHGIKNAIAVEGTSVPETIIKLSKERIVTAFTDGDRGGELILKELLQVADVDYVARAPEGKEVEELTKKEIVKALRSKVPAEQVITEIFYKGRNFYEVIKEKERAKNGREEKVREVKPPAPAPAPAPAPKPIEKPEPKEREEKIVKPIQQPRPSELDEFGEFIEKVKSSKDSMALLLDKDKSVIAEIPVRELTNQLKERKDVYAVVFNGVITQRLIDTVSESGVKYLVGARKYNVVRRPVNLKIVTFAE
ncbi:DnaG-related protein [Thermococcus onnurineus NA1]|uniref:DNA primase DnaG n=1 Tax=Thermococcus onnurineus (strain NA1) TaxID=523850 RepID=DNAG_THEON|nr:MULTISPECIES: DNA primase DnaG [Thermococcus]B6YSY6.1 RecName: Full=DNA primase DnaG [Thermococcus onnurineus NA1]ACJ15673.1 DnaG-related protein [Thermococcus onnurineus NA1]NJE46986.1 DNA primase [Thermococcus sp. GR7]NJE78962.1 DNA primase [Thermococcus sp. GR4]NJF22694.1 DNA primase [Thermococcus sp. GR5]